MGDLHDKLDEIQNMSKTAYEEILKVLEDSYCWKCPMRSTRTQSRCREVHAGRVVQEAMEKGILNLLQDSKIPEVEFEAIIVRMLKKKIKKEGGKQQETIIIFKVSSEQNQDLIDEQLMVKVNPRRVKIGEKILIPPEPLEHPLLGSVALITGFPFVIEEVKRIFHEGSFWYVDVNKRILPLDSVLGVFIKILSDEL